MLGLIVVALLSTSPSLDAVNQENPTAEYILTLRPKLGIPKAVRLAALIDRWAQHYDVEPEVMVALVAHESKFRSGIKACWPHAKKPGVITCDHGLAQINEAWIRQWKLDENKLQYDDSYNLRVQARILASIKKEYGYEPEWYGRYHSKTPSKKRRYLDKIRPILDRAPSRNLPSQEPQDMLLSARMLEGVADANNFNYAEAAKMTEGDTLTVYFQLVDMAKDLATAGFVPAGRRYIPATGSTLSVTFDNIDNARKVTRAATQPYPADPSIWSVQVLASDRILGTVNMRLVLTQGGIVTQGIVLAAVQSASLSGMTRI